MAQKGSSSLTGSAARTAGPSGWEGCVWVHWSSPYGSELQTCCILTTTPNALLRPIHDRMPVVINDGWEEAWLLPEEAAELRGLEALMAPWDPAGWEAIPVDWL